MDCYLWELEALLEGLALRELDQQEKNAVFGFNLRYILNAKKPSLKKVIDKPKQESKIRQLFSRKANTSRKKERTQRVIDALNHFKNRG